MCLIICYLLSRWPVCYHWCRALRSADSSGAELHGSSSGAAGEEGLLLQEQCAPLMALHHPRPAGPWSQKVLWKVLCRLHRPHQWVSILLLSDQSSQTIQSALPVSCLQVFANCSLSCWRSPCSWGSKFMSTWSLKSWWSQQRTSTDTVRPKSLNKGAAVWIIKARQCCMYC